MPNLGEAKVSRESEVTAQLNKLDSSVDSLEESISSLITRLSSVLKGADIGKSESPPKEELVQLAHAIRSPRERLEICVGTISSILNRLEL